MREVVRESVVGETVAGEPLQADDLQGVPTAPEVPGYRLGERLGSGASGSVWAGVRALDGAPVAVKVVPVGGFDEFEERDDSDGPDGPRWDDRAHRAAREVAVLARVEVEGVVGFHEAFALDGAPPAVAIVLDRIEGGSLERAVGARGHLSVGESVTVLAPIARALAGLHAAGVVHGDVSPANVLLERSGRPLLADLGVARLAGEQPGDFYGTAGFAAPEVAFGAGSTSASDVYAVGALAWWTVTGVPPGLGALRRPLAQVAPGLPESWREATEQALLGDPSLRPTAAELAVAYFDSAACEPLRLVVGEDETSLLTQRLRRAHHPPEHVPPAAASGRWQRWARRRWARRRSARQRWAGRRWRVGVFGIAPPGAALLLGGALIVHGGGLPSAERSASTPPAAPTAAPIRSDRAQSNRAQSSRVQADRGQSDRVRSDPAAARRDPGALMQALADLRAQLMNEGAKAELVRLDVPGSALLADDAARIDQLAASGRSYADVALRVRRTRLRAVSSTAATVDAVVDTAAYRIVGPAGQTQGRPAVPGAVLRFELRWDRTWRIAGVTVVG